jgi:transcriptional regulator with XRE-family HTH domain
MENSEKSEKHYRRLCKLVIRARKAKKLTQKDMAQRLGHTQSCIAKLERGLRPVTLLQYLQMGEIIGFDPARLVRRATKE